MFAGSGHDLTDILCSDLGIGLRWFWYHIWWIDQLWNIDVSSEGKRKMETLFSHNLCDQTTPHPVSPAHVLSVPLPIVLFINQWRLRSLEKNPEEAGLSPWVWASPLAWAFSPPSPSSPSSCSSSDWSSSSKSSTSLSDSSASSNSLVESGSVDRSGSLSAARPTAASILSWMAAVTAAVMTLPAIWLTNSRALSMGWSLWGEGVCLDLIGCWGWGGGEGRPRLRSSSSSPLVVAPLSSEGNSGRPLVNASSLSRSVGGLKKDRSFKKLW